MVESGNPKAIGWLSSIVAIILALLLLHTFPLMGNWIDKQRAGEGKYEFEEEMCFDINDEKQFDNNYIPPSNGVTGAGALKYQYVYGTPPASWIYYSPVDVMFPYLNDTVGGYGVSATQKRAGDELTESSIRYYYIQFRLNFTKKEIIEKDITRIDIYLDIHGALFPTIKGVIGNIDLGTISLGNLTKIEIKVTDLLKINTLADDTKIEVKFTTFEYADRIPANTFVIFDMQWYCIEEIKAPTITRLAGWMSLMNIGILILVFISFPQVQVLGRFNSMGERLKKI